MQTCTHTSSCSASLAAPCHTNLSVIQASCSPTWPEVGDQCCMHLGFYTPCHCFWYSSPPLLTLWKSNNGVCGEIMLQVWYTLEVPCPGFTFTQKQFITQYALKTFFPFLWSLLSYCQMLQLDSIPWWFMQYVFSVKFFSWLASANFPLTLFFM